jgi:XTP/dITP diphosphohydrolase
MRVVLATANPDKAREIREIFAASPTVELVDRPLEVPDVDETGSTLEANALLKAEALVAATGIAAVADDTGLFVDALSGAPGVFSARYAGEHATYADNVDKLLAALKDLDVPRSARFQTAAVFVTPAGSRSITIGTVEGTITREARGSRGFGYDPVFVPLEGDGRTLAELDDEEKHAISHRGRAFRALAAALEEGRTA